MSTMVEIKKAIMTLPPTEREELANWLLFSGKTSLPGSINAIHPDVLSITGLAPENTDAESAHQQRLLRKHK